ANDLLDRPAFNKVLPPDPADRLHNQHPPSTRSHPQRATCASLRKGGQYWTPITPLPGSIFHAETQIRSPRERFQRDRTARKRGDLRGAARHPVAKAADD